MPKRRYVSSERRFGPRSKPSTPFSCGGSISDIGDVPRALKDVKCAALVYLKTELDAAIARVLKLEQWCHDNYVCIGCGFLEEYCVCEDSDEHSVSSGD